MEEFELIRGIFRRSYGFMKTCVFVNCYERQWLRLVSEFYRADLAELVRVSNAAGKARERAEAFAKAMAAAVVEWLAEVAERKRGEA